MASRNGQTALSIFSSWEGRDFDGLVSNMSDDVLVEDQARGEKLSGRDATKGWFASWAEACPDSVVNANVIGEGDDTVVIQGLWEGTNQGPLGPMPATGKRVMLPFINVLQFDTDGRVVRSAGYYDQLSIMTQLGHMPAAG